MNRQIDQCHSTWRIGWRLELLLAFAPSTVHQPRNEVGLVSGLLRIVELALVTNREDPDFAARRYEEF